MTASAGVAVVVDVAVAADAGDGERGAATVWAVGVIVVLMSVAVFGLHLGAALVARHQAQSAADLAALAGAAAISDGARYACAQAELVTGRMGVRLVTCRADGWDVLVEVAARPGGALSRLGEATGRARAGPITR